MNSKKLKLDLHVHLREAMGCTQPSFSLAKEVVGVIRQRGLDGIAITDHDQKDFGFQLKEIIETHFNDIVIIPGKEVSHGPHHVVELYLGDDVTFRFIAHPGNLSDMAGMVKNSIHGLEIENGCWAVDREKVSALAEEFGLILLSNSDAHSPSDIGRYYNYIELEELRRRARRSLAACSSFEKEFKVPK